MESRATSEGIRERWTEAALFGFVLLLASSYFKRSFLSREGTDLVEHFLRDSGSVAVDWLSLYARDAVECLLIFPLALLALGARFDRRGRIRASLVALLLLLAAQTFAWTIHNAFGSYPTLSLISDFLDAYAADPDIVDPRATLAKLYFSRPIALFAIAIGLGSLLHSKNGPDRLRRLGTVGFAALLLPGAAGVALALSEPLSTPFHQGQIDRFFTLLLRSEARLTLDDDVDAHGLMRSYRGLVFPDGQAGDEGVATPAAADGAPDVLWIELESIAQRDCNFRRDAENMPNVARLLSHALVTESHLAPSYFSIRSDFALLASVYDGPGGQRSTQLLSDGETRGAPVEIDALPAILRERGYATRYYYPTALTFSEDRWLIERFGFQHVNLGSQDDVQGDSADRRIEAETRMFDRAALDIRGLAGDGAPDLFFVRSVIGHYPLLDPVARSEPRITAANRARVTRRLAHFQDALIGRLLDALEAAGTLDETLVVITADHGPRLPEEDPTLVPRFLNEGSFRVPLLIYQPVSFPTPRVIEHVTSHIDVTPSALALLGIEGDGFLHQGLPLWDPRLRNRITLFAGLDHGERGLHYRGRYFMEDRDGLIPFVNDRFEFGPANVVEPGGALSDEVLAYHGFLEGMNRLRGRWIAHLLAERPGA